MALNLDRLKELQEEWGKLQPLLPESEQRFWQKLSLEWNYHSNHIEGNTLTYGETANLLLHDQMSGDHTGREYDEMKGHDLAIRLVRDLAANSRELTEADIRNLNQVLLKEPFYKEAITPTGEPTQKLITPGQYKQQPNSVRTATGQIFEYAAPMDVSARMAKLVQAIRNMATKDELEFFAALAIIHHEFTLIHPFDDGNGRVARLLTNYSLLKKGLPPIVIRSEAKTNYLSGLRKADVGDPTALTEFLAENLVWSLELGIKAARGESLEEPSDVEKEIELFVREQLANQTEPVRKNLRDIQEFWFHCLKPLLHKLDEKTIELGKLFRSRNLRVQLDGTIFKDMTEGDAGAKNILASSTVNFIQFALLLDGYRGPASVPFGLKHFLTIQLDEFEIIFDTGVLQPKLRLPYSKRLSAADIENIIATITRDLFQQIKRNSGN